MLSCVQQEPVQIVASVCSGFTPVLNYYVTFFLIKKPPERRLFYFASGTGVFCRDEMSNYRIKIKITKISYIFVDFCNLL